MMNFRVLKKARVVVSLIFFLLITYIFIDFTNALSVALIQAILYLEFVPSLLNFISLAGIAATGFIIIIILTLLFGRIYCSTVCPLGTLQDIFIWLKRRFTRKKQFRKSRTFNQLWYAILILSTLLMVFGWIFPLLLLDPLSNFGRIIVNLVRPVYLLLNNFGAFFLESVDIYSLYRVEPGVTSWFSILFSMAFLIMLIWLSLRNARLFCNTLCPVGAFLGILSKFSVFKIYLNQAICTSCGKCSAVCKAGCIDKDKKTVDFSRCIGCLNCLTTCPDNGIMFGRPQKNPDIMLKPFDSNRRNFLAGGFLSLASLASISLLAEPQGRRRGRDRPPLPVIKKYPVSPPGSISLEHFNASCTACHLCVSACPTHVIKPSLLQYGLSGLMQPRMNYHASFCNFDCVICSEICPTGALQPLIIEEKHVLQLGKVKFIKQNCIVFTEGTDCGACSEHCPTKAVKMRPFRKTLLLPVVDPDICVGCGACEYACPTHPKSIYVEGNPVHLTADKPKIEKLEQPDIDDDFPF